MKAADFRYECPKSLQDALILLQKHGDDATPIAGGQSLMPMMNFRMAAPDVLVDLNAVESLKCIDLVDGHIRIGAMTRYVELMQSDVVQKHVPLFAKALPHIAHAAIRNRGTIGGSVSLADPAAEMPALLLALNATITVQNLDGVRRIAADDFFEGVYETALEEGELVTEISIPAAREGDRFSFYELARRHGDYAMTGVAIAATGSPALSGCRIAFFAVSDRAIRAVVAEEIMEGGHTDDTMRIEQAIEALASIDFMGDLNAEAKAKQHLSGVVLKRALAEL